ncbi:uncharacterized protein B0I36DRAFT_357058 [Microdochium trichocladiopsis]|uniref:Uncharacterized protein n=1 Tax=Microdochium trichocladiopsis TaxID=1682393 RepID=A0A9P9BUW4_9PEZI|nr:uncharacterized protein B0I36DRAFT_357058 [Microdochium trichocladiopsis]KAH7039658.1 hypothetical protein B0I36DRAFT_357058 [Microdochium trichocladiopsis]
MKTSFATLITSALAATTSMVTAAPSGSTGTGTDTIAERDNCFYPSSCSSTWSGKCEDYCGTRGFSHMTGEDCEWPSKKCCCITEI